MRKWIANLQEGDRINGVYLCKSKQGMISKAGKPYDNVQLQDKTGTLDAKIWDPLSQGIEEFHPMEYVSLVGDVSSYQGKLQLSIKRARRAAEGEYDPKDYIPVSDRDIDGMYEQLLRDADSVTEPHLHALLGAFFRDPDFRKQFCFHSAAKSVHHGFVGGLLQHTLGVANTCKFLAKQYPLLQRDLLLTAALLHDIGKLRELSPFPQNDYTDEGNLLGHITIGAAWVGEKIGQIDGFPTSLKNELLHCILAHHGQLEFGSPKRPALAEALALSYADDIDAKMETIKELLDTVPPDQTAWLGYQKLLESNFRRTSPL